MLGAAPQAGHDQTACCALCQVRGPDVEIDAQALSGHIQQRFVGQVGASRRRAQQWRRLRCRAAGAFLEWLAALLCSGHLLQGVERERLPLLPLQVLTEGQEVTFEYQGTNYLLRVGGQPRCCTYALCQGGGILAGWRGTQPGRLQAAAARQGRLQRVVS